MATSEPSNHLQPFRFFDLPREIRDNIYLRLVYVPGARGRDKCYWRRTHQRKKITIADHPHNEVYFEGINIVHWVISLFKVSRQFCDESLPIFWQEHFFAFQCQLSLAPEEAFDRPTPQTRTLPPNWVCTSLDYFTPFQKANLRSLGVHIWCVVFYKPTTNNEFDYFKKNELVTDFGITVQNLLKEIPNLQELEIELHCRIRFCAHYGVWDEGKVKDLLREVTEDDLEFYAPWDFFNDENSAGVVVNLDGLMLARRRRGKKPVKSVEEEEAKEVEKVRGRPLVR